MTLRGFLSLIFALAIIGTAGAFTLLFLAIFGVLGTGETTSSVAVSTPTQTISPTPTIEKSTNIPTEGIEPTPTMRPTPTRILTPTPKPSPTPSPTPMKAVDFYREYQENEIRADMKYEGKKVYLEGIVGTVEKDGSGFKIKLIGSRRGAAGIGYGFITDAIVCNVGGAYARKVAELKIGKTIMVSGYVEEIGLFGDVPLRACRIIE